jgi:hypothetical protein
LQASTGDALVLFPVNSSKPTPSIGVIEGSIYPKKPLVPLAQPVIVSLPSTTKLIFPFVIVPTNLVVDIQWGVVDVF